MTRAIWSICLFAVLVAGGSTALAQKKKEKIAILGLEVVSGSANIDSESTRVAQELTVALRLRPKAQQGPYAFTPGSEKELIDEKLMNNCDNEAKDCMAKIGEKLGADHIMYGKIEKKNQGGSAGYQISLKLLRVKDQGFNAWTDFIPIADTNSGPKLGDWARKGYKKITNENEGGTLVILTRNVERATILIEGDDRGNINNNRGEVQLPEGRYKVAVVATGYHRWSSDGEIVIKNNETTTEEIALKEMKTGDTELCDARVSTCENTGSDAPKTGFWKGLMWGGIVVAVGGGGFAAFSFTKVGKAEDDLQGLPDGAERDRLEAEGEKQATRANIGWGIAGAGVAIAAIGLFKGYVFTGKEKQAAGSTTVGRARKRPSGFSVTPVVGRESAGATIRLDW